MAGSGGATGYTISGITGGYPVCTKVELLQALDYGMTLGWEVIDTQTITDNNPNKSVVKSFVLTTEIYGIRLYDAEGNLIAEKLPV